MLEDQFYRSKLISGYLRGELNEAEEEELNTWIAASPENSNYLQQEFGNEELVRHLLTEYNSLDENVVWDKILSKLQISKEQAQSSPDIYKVHQDADLASKDLNVSSKDLHETSGDLNVTSKDLNVSSKDLNVMFKDLHEASGDLDEASGDLDEGFKYSKRGLRSNKIHFLNYKLMAAAALFIIGTLSFKLFHFIGTNNHPKYSTNIGAGKSGATLTLADGRKLRLSEAGEGQLAEESGMRITKTGGGQVIYTALANSAGADVKADGYVKKGQLQLNTLATSNGEQYQLILPDQTKVWLNAGSSITFPASFAGLRSRNVEITGEVYFEVAKVYTTSLRKGTAGSIQRVPFIVGTTGQQVEVLGTHFNINAYVDEPAIKTTLLEGLVAVHRTANKSTTANKSENPGNQEKVEKVENADDAAATGVMLTPGQQSILQGQHLKVAPADIENATAWKKGDFVFKGEDFKATMRKIARWYNVEIIYDPSVPADIELAGWISRESRLSLVLERIELAGNIHFKVEGRRITIMK